MPNYAKFTIEGTASSPGGYDAAASQVLDFALEGGPASVVQRWTLEVFSVSNPNAPLASKNAPTLTLVGATSGQTVDASTPASTITCVLPVVGAQTGHSWLVRSKVNGGIDANGKASGDYVFERMVSIRTAKGRRKIVATEGTQYSPRGWADAQNDDTDIPTGVASPINPTDNFKFAYASAGDLSYGTAVTTVAGGATATFFGLETATAAAPAFVARSGGHGMYSGAAAELTFACTSVETMQLVHAGGVNEHQLRLGRATTTNTVRIGMAQGRTGDGSCQIDLSSSIGVNDSLRINRGAGVNGISQLIHKGIGELQLRTEDSAPIQIITTAIGRWYFENGGNFRPVTDATMQIGTSTNRVSQGHFSSFLAIGTNPAATGGLRVANGIASSIRYRNAANTADLDALAVNASNVVILGGDTGAAETQMRSPAGLAFYSNAVLELNISAGLINAQDNEIRTTGFYTRGATPATVGQIRLTNNDIITARNSANTADADLLTLNISNQLVVGEATDVDRVWCIAATDFQVSIGAAVQLNITATVADFQDNEIRTTGFYSFGSAAGVATIRSGTGTPEGIVTANDGSLWLRTDGVSGTTAYFKEDGVGNTGWNPIAGWTQTISLTIATGAITIPSTAGAPIVIINVDTEAAAATDDLDIINGGINGQIIILNSVNSGRDVTARDAISDLSLVANRVLSHPLDSLTLRRVVANSWQEIGYADTTA